MFLLWLVITIIFSAFAVFFTEAHRQQSAARNRMALLQEITNLKLELGGLQ